jgi:hypothetical protein
MRALAVLAIVVGGLGRAEARRPSVAREAAKVGLAGKPDHEASAPSSVGVLEKRTWKNDLGHRWEYVKVVDGRKVVRVEGLQLNNGRSLSILRHQQGGRQRLVLTSRWTWGRTPILQENYDGRSRRISGGGLLRRMTGYGIPSDGPLRFTSEADSPARTKAQMAIMARKRGQPIAVDVNLELVVAEPAP